MSLDTAVPIAVDLLTKLEGFRPFPYFDVNGYAIGYGNHYYEDGSPVSADDDPITQDRATQLLTYFATQNGQAIVNQVTTPLSDNQLAALISIRYNCGTITQALLNLVNSGASSQDIADQIKRTCITSQGAVNPELISRRVTEAGLFLSPGMGSIAFLGALALAALIWVLVK